VTCILPSRRTTLTFQAAVRVLSYDTTSSEGSFFNFLKARRFRVVIRNSKLPGCAFRLQSTVAQPATLGKSSVNPVRNSWHKLSPPGATVEARAPQTAVLAPSHFLSGPAYVTSVGVRFSGHFASAYAPAEWLHKATFLHSPLRNAPPKLQRCVWT
jgi:hypothetical protein